MKKLPLFVLLMLIAASPLLAQTKSEWEIFGGYSIKRAEVREYYRQTPTIYNLRNVSEDLGGWQASITENKNHWLGGTAEFSGHYKNPVQGNVTSRQKTYSLLYGPRITFRFPRWGTPFAHVLIGIDRASVAVTSVVPAGPHADQTSLAGAAGGGFDLHLTKRLSARVIQADFFRSNVLSTKQNKFRLTAGVVLHLGATPK